MRSINQEELVSDAEVSLRSLSANKAAKRSATFGVTVLSGRQPSMGNVSNRAASSSPMRMSRRIRRAESFASNLLRKAVHLAHVSVSGRSRNSTWSRQNSSRRSQCWIRLEALKELSRHLGGDAHPRDLPLFQRSERLKFSQNVLVSNSALAVPATPAIIDSAIRTDQTVFMMISPAFLC